MSFAREFPTVLSPLPIPILSSNPVIAIGQLQRHIQNLHKLIADLNFQIAEGFQNIILEGTTAQKPTAIQSGRLYWDTDLNRLEYDNGTWQVV